MHTYNFFIYLFSIPSVTRRVDKNGICICIKMCYFKSYPIFTHWFIYWNHQLSVNIKAIASQVMVTKVYNCNERFSHFWLIMWKSRADIQKTYRQGEEQCGQFIERKRLINNVLYKSLNLRYIVTGFEFSTYICIPLLIRSMCLFWKDLNIDEFPVCGTYWIFKISHS